MDPKITMLFLLIGTVITLSNDDRLGRVRRQIAARGWRRFVRGPRKE